MLIYLIIRQALSKLCTKWAFVNNYLLKFDGERRYKAYEN